PLDEDMDSTAMAEAMGFSGFGMQPGAKKRKFNPHADASVSGLPKKPSAAGSRNTTGANSAPLGQRSLPPPSASLPSRPPIAAVPRHAQNQRQSGRRMRGSDQNADDQPWWEGYYDAKMNQNPWERLEKQRGLEPRGTWLTRHTNANA
ncbi:hypothetical protein M406DRAFT_19912, partial [Cryphonectria parasitica EP155]